MEPFKPRWTPEAVEELQDLGNKSAQELILKRAEEICKNPHQHGVPLRGELAGKRRAHVSRYRLIWEVDDKTREVVFVGTGIRQSGNRRDVYNKMKRRRRH